MSSIVYLMGAGASFNALPVIQNFSERFNLFTAYIRYVIDRDNLNSNGRFNGKLQLIEKVETLIDEYKTPDTVARVFFLQPASGMEYSFVKNLLSTYMLFEQLNKGFGENDYREVFNRLTYPRDYEEGEKSFNSLNRLLDHRYISLLSTMATIDESGRVDFPGNVSFVTWNYDLQMITAMQRVSKGRSVDQVIEQFGALGVKDYKMKDEARIHYLNGIAQFANTKISRLGYRFDPVSETLDESLERLITILFTNEGAYFENYLSFAWEDEPHIKQARNHARKKIANADIVVVIGYSFPDFNRQIDIELFKLADKIKKIYVQDTQPELVIDKLNGVKYGLVKKATPIHNTHQFQIPIEFWEVQTRPGILAHSGP